eukprot:scaffold21071_cov58-Phaeocystis_antarctica.AAC.4
MGQLYLLVPERRKILCCPSWKSVSCSPNAIAIASTNCEGRSACSGAQRLLGAIKHRPKLCDEVGH